jgi:hypothetical protein
VRRVVLSVRGVAECVIRSDLLPSTIAAVDGTGLSRKENKTLKTVRQADQASHPPALRSIQGMRSSCLRPTRVMHTPV